MFHRRWTASAINRIGLLLLIALLNATFGTVSAGAAGTGNGSAGIAAEPPLPTETLTLPGGKAQTGPTLVFVELMGDPTADVYTGIIGGPLQPGGQPDAVAAAAARQQQTRDIADQQQVAATLTGSQFNAHVVYRVHRVLNGMAINVDATKIEAIRQLPGVRAVYPIPLETIENSTSVPFLGTPQLWADTIGLGMNVTGAGIKMGIIDTGYRLPAGRLWWDRSAGRLPGQRPHGCAGRLFPHRQGRRRLRFCGRWL